MKDYIVEDVRQVRDEHAARFNYDVELIVADLKKSEAERDWPRASCAPRRVHRLVPGGEQLLAPDKF